MNELSAELKKDLVLSIQQKLTENGEKTNVSISVGKNKTPLPPSIILMQTFATLSAINLKSGSCKVLFYILGKSTFENWIGIDILTIVKDIKMSKQSVLRAMKELKDYNIITAFVNPSDKRRKDYFIHPVAAWKGGNKNRLATIGHIGSHPSLRNQMQLFDETIEESRIREGKEINQAKGKKISLPNLEEE